MGVGSGTVLISATKGFDPLHLRRISQVVEHHRSADGLPVAVLSGPNFAEEVALGEPTLSVIACQDAATATRIQKAFHTNTFRLYTTTDTVGVEVGGALKNVVALAAGVIHGLGLGNNTQAALMTRGLAEITRLAIAMGGQPATLAGLAGLGDLVLTCTGGLSRNRRAGILLAEGQTKEQVIASTRMVAEGINSTYAACALAEQHKVEMPIAQQMRRILEGELPPLEAVRQLMERAPKGE
jgi:glycerol-3-phosphate dehydrogenase (NAD(P)+)